VSSEPREREAKERKRTRKVSPTTQLGLPLPLGILLPMSRSKMAPRHCELPLDTCPRFISFALIGQDFPPKESEMVTVVLHAK